MKRLAAVVILLGLGALAGCGPVQSTAYLLDAEVQIEAARTAGADKLAPYEWTAANLYIHKAREEIAYSAYEQGVEFAQKASRFANEARTHSMAATAKGEVPTSTPSP
jgi:hypothetical protein